MANYKSNLSTNKWRNCIFPRSFERRVLPLKLNLICMFSCCWLNAFSARQVETFIDCWSAIYERVRIIRLIRLDCQINSLINQFTSRINWTVIGLNWISIEYIVSWAILINSIELDLNRIKLMSKSIKSLLDSIEIELESNPFDY